MTYDVELENVRKSFGSVEAVAGVTFDVQHETFFSLLGPSGCGKTTLLRMIAGFETPTSGEIRIRGEVVNRVPPYRRDTAMVFQNYALFPHMNVAENVAFGLRYRSRSTQAERYRMVGEALELVGLGGLDKRLPGQLSGGQQQRVALARAIVVRPALLLLDEPLSNLDLRLRQQMRTELRRIQREVRLTTVYVTHDQSEAFSVSDHIAIMNRGELIQVGTPDDIFLRPRTEFVVQFIGESNHVPVQVLESVPGGLVVKSRAGGIVRVDNVRDELLSVSAGSSLELYLRDEQLKLQPEKSSVNSFAGTVASVQNLGALRSCLVDVPEIAKLRVVVPATQVRPTSPGDTVFVEIAPADCVLLADTSA